MTTEPFTLCSGDYVLAEHALNVGTGISVTGNNIFLFQAPLTSTDTAILSGNLSTQNGNGGGSINLALRRVTSAKGWGEVRLHLLYSFICNLLPSVLFFFEEGTLAVVHLSFSMFCKM